MFDELRQGVKALEFLTDPTAGELRLGCTETMAAGFVSAVSDRVSRQNPRVVFQLIPGDSVTLVNRELRQRTIDFAVGAESRLKLDEDVGADILFDDQFVVMAGAESKWIRRRKLRLADLIDEPWVLPPTDSVPEASIAQTLRASGLEPPRAQMISFSLPLHYHLLSTGRFLPHNATALDAAVREAPAAQIAASRYPQKSLSNCDHHPEEPHAQPIGAALHRVRPRNCQATGT